MQSDKTNSTIPSPEEQRIEHLRRKVVGFFLLPIAIFPLLALLTYDWHAVEALQIPAITPTTNLIGVVGDSFAYRGYMILGLGVWVIPLLCILVGLLLLFERDIHPGRRTVWLTVFTVALCCLLQLLSGTEPIVGWLESVNTGRNAGGAIGYLVMTRCLSKLLSPFGSGMLMISIMLISLMLAIGLREIAVGILRLTAWATGREYDPSSEPPPNETREERKARKAAEKEAKRLEKERLRAEKEAAIQAAKEAAEAARAEREAEKARAAAEKEAERRRRDEEEDFRRRQEEFERQQAEFERQRAAEAANSAAARIAAAKAAAAAENHPERTMSARVGNARVGVDETPPAEAGSPAESEQEQVEDKGPYILPATELLRPVPVDAAGATNLDDVKSVIVNTLETYGVKATITDAIQGPTVTQYAITPDIGVKMSDITSLRKELQGALMVENMRVIAPIPGKNAVGLEVPNSTPSAVHFRSVIESEAWKKATEKMQVPLLLGRDIAGHELIADLAKLPHLLVAGATGKGKSVGLNAMICGLLMCRTPEQLRFIMVDPKRVEFTGYNKLPHLLIPVVNDNAKVVFALKWAVQEMSNRLKLFNKANVKNIVAYNTRPKVEQGDLFGGEAAADGNPDMPEKVPYIVIVVDEVADIMQTSGKEVEPVIARLAALARATGIHLILATQRPDTKVITGTIKGNIPGRIAYKTSSAIDSRTILDATGAEALIGNGDMLYKMPDGNLVRAQGAWIKDDDIASVLAFIEQHSNPEFDAKLTNRIEKIKVEETDILAEDEDEDNESGKQSSSDMPKAVNGIQPPVGIGTQEEMELYVQALDVVRRTKRASTSHLQRKMNIGYNHAARLMDHLEENGIIGPAKGGSAVREILVDLDELLKVPQVPFDGGQEGTAPAGGAQAPEAGAEQISNNATNEELIWTSDQQ